MYLNKYQLPLHNIIIMYTSLHVILVMHYTFSTETLGHVIFPHKAGDHVTKGLQTKRTHLPGEHHFKTSQ